MKKRTIILVAILLLFVSGGLGLSAVSKWIDGDGKVIVGIDPPEIELYVTSWCGYCKQAVAFFRSRGVAYREYDVEKDREAARRKRKLGGGNGVPFAVINGRKIQGFSEQAYEKALDAER